jgi:hypothetical protein
MLVEAGFKVGDLGLERGNLLMEQEMFSLKLGKQTLNEGTNVRGRRGPVNGRDARWRCHLVHDGSFADQQVSVKSEHMCSDSADSRRGT